MKHLILSAIKIGALSILLFGGVEALAQEFKFQVEHDHAFKSCKGELIINRNGVEYQTENKDHARRWTYTNIKMIKLVSSIEIEILSYESSRKALRGDRSFEFKVLSGELSKEVSDFLLAWVDRPLATSFVTTEEKPQYEIPVRHRHQFSGCQGTLKIFGDKVIYESGSPKNSRHWRLTDIKSISRTGPYQFGITTYEPKFGGPTKTYNFDLKEQMSDAIYDYVWARVYKVTLPAKPGDKQLAERAKP